jgi:hypothetical protein
MPYFQIQGLQALLSYLEVLGFNSISELTTGKGKPPQNDPQVFLGNIQFTSGTVPAKSYNFGDSSLSFPNSPSCLLSIPSVASTSTMTKSSLPSFKRHSIQADPSIPAAFRTVPHPYINRISDALFIVTDNFSSPIQHYTYPAAAIFACLIHDSAIRNDPTKMKDQPSPIGYDVLARVYNGEARGNQRFSYYSPHASTTSAITYGESIQPDDWNITPAQRGIITENPLFQQLLEEDVARNLRRKATIQSQIERRQAAKFHKRDNDAIKQFAATHQTKIASKLKGKKKAFISKPITAAAQSIASSSATTLESTIPTVATSSTADISMTGPIDAFTLTADEMLAAFEEDAPFESDPAFFDNLPDTTA